MTFNKHYTFVWLLPIMLVFSACARPIAEPGIEFDTNSTTGNSLAQQPYPPIQQLKEEQLQASYPGPNVTPSLATALPTIVPLPTCDIKPPIEIVMSYEEVPSNFPVFSEPTIVVTNDVGFSIAEWLPDNRRLLISQGDGAFGTISTLDVTTGEMVEYAQRRDVSNQPIWLDEAQGVMFVEVTTEGRELRFSNGQEVTPLASELASVSLAKDTSGERVATLFSSELGALMTVDTIGQIEFVTTIGLNEDTKRVPSSGGDGYHLAWSPDRNWLVQYDGESLYLINTQTQNICSVDLGDYGEAGRGNVFGVHWSPNSRYLSMTIQRQNPIPELNILDMENMDLSILSFPLDFETWPPERIGSPVWSPDSRMILLQTGKHDAEIARTQAKLLIMNVQTHQYTNVFPDYTFFPGIGRMVWSSNGSTVAYSCHTATEGNICIMSVLQ